MFFFQMRKDKKDVREALGSKEETESPLSKKEIKLMLDLAQSYNGNNDYEKLIEEKGMKK